MTSLELREPDLRPQTGNWTEKLPGANWLSFDNRVHPHLSLVVVLFLDNHPI